MLGNCSKFENAPFLASPSGFPFRRSLRRLLCCKAWNLGWISVTSLSRDPSENHTSIEQPQLSYFFFDISSFLCPFLGISRLLPSKYRNGFQRQKTFLRRRWCLASASIFAPFSSMRFCSRPSEVECYITGLWLMSLLTILTSDVQEFCGWVCKAHIIFESLTNGVEHSMHFPTSKQRPSSAICLDQRGWYSLSRSQPRLPKWKARDNCLLVQEGKSNHVHTNYSENCKDKDQHLGSTAAQCVVNFPVQFLLITSVFTGQDGSSTWCLSCHNNVIVVSVWTVWTVI